MADAAVADAPAPDAGTKPPLRKVSVGASPIDALIPQQLRESQAAALQKEMAARKAIEPQLQAEYAKQTALKVPDAPTYQQAPEHQDVKVRPPYEALGQFLPMLAVIGSGFARKSARGALKAAIGAMEGQQKGDVEAQERNDKDFEEKLKEISAHNMILKDQFQEAMDGYKASNEEGDRRIATLLRTMDMPHQEVLMAQGQRALVVDALKTTIGVSGHMHEIMHQAATEAIERQKLDVERSRVKAEFAEAQARLAESHADRLDRQNEFWIKDIDRRREDMIKKDKPAYAVEAIAQNQAKVDDAIAHPERYVNPAGNALVADTFTRTFNGGNAIRGFQMRMLQHDRTLWNQAGSLANKATTGGTFTASEIQAMAKMVKQATPELIEGYKYQAMEAVKDAIADGAPRPYEVIPESLRHLNEQLGFGANAAGGSVSPPAAPTPAHAPAAQPSAAPAHRQRAASPGGHTIYSDDGGNTWFDEQTHKRVP